MKNLQFKSSIKKQSEARYIAERIIRTYYDNKEFKFLYADFAGVNITICIHDSNGNITIGEAVRSKLDYRIGEAIALLNVLGEPIPKELLEEGA